MSADEWPTVGADVALVHFSGFRGDPTHETRATVARLLKTQIALSNGARVNRVTLTQTAGSGPWSRPSAQLFDPSSDEYVAIRKKMLFTRAWTALISTVRSIPSGPPDVDLVQQLRSDCDRFLIEAERSES